MLYSWVPVARTEHCQSEIANLRSKSIMDAAADVKGIKVASAMLTNIKADVLRKMADEIKAAHDDIIIVLAGVDGEKANFAVGVGKEALARGAHAGKIAGRVAALTGGKGGGRPDSAMAGVGDRFKIDEALDQTEEIAAEFIK